MNKAERLIELADSIHNAHSLATRKENQIECTSFAKEDKDLIEWAIRTLARALRLDKL